MSKKNEAPVQMTMTTIPAEVEGELNRLWEELEESVKRNTMLEERLDFYMNMIAAQNKVIEDFEARIKALEAKPMSRDSRGRPDSTRTMNESDAREILLGSLKGKTHKEAAEALGLSYGQVYSARNGFTFKTIKAEADKIAAEEKAAKENPTTSK